MIISDTKIRMGGLRFFARHGVLPQETEVGAMFTVDLVIETDFTRAAMTDTLDESISYADVFDCVKSEMERPSKLLENVIKRIGERILRDFDTANCVSVALYKENPPMGADCDRVGVSACFKRA